MINYTPIQSCLDRNYIPAPIRKEVDDDTLLSWCLDGYRMLNLNQEYETKIKIIPIVNHNASIPDDAYNINNVTYLNCNECQDSIATQMPIQTPSNYNIFYKIWEESHFYNERFMPMRNVGNSSSLLCTQCKNQMLSRCNETYSITPSKTLLTSIKEGFICLDYEAIIKNEQGDYMIINTPEIKRFLGLYAQSMSWLERASSKEEQAFGIYEKLLAQTEIAMRRARGSNFMGGINMHNVTSITGSDTVNSRLIKLPLAYLQNSR
jgi:hypothetical protein